MRIKITAAITFPESNERLDTPTTAKSPKKNLLFI